MTSGREEEGRPTLRPPTGPYAEHTVGGHVPNGEHLGCSCRGPAEPTSEGLSWNVIGSTQGSCGGTGSSDERGVSFVPHESTSSRHLVGPTTLSRLNSLYMCFGPECPRNVYTCTQHSGDPSSTTVCRNCEGACGIRRRRLTEKDTDSPRHPLDRRVKNTGHLRYRGTGSQGQNVPR